MNSKTWGVLCLVVAGFSIGLTGACAPTSPLDERAVVGEALTICGNGVCDTGETCASCPGDCGRCTQEHCGNDVCGRKETCVTCERDCGICSGCGNGVCEGTETCANCAADCGRCSGEFCGNGVCARRESCTACARDCCPSAPQCVVAADCPATGNECIARTCTAGQCGTTFVASGTLLSTQTAGDCQLAQCDGAGGIVQVADDSDLPPDDANECTAQSCNGGAPSYPPLQTGTSCMGSFFCDGAGSCVQCLSFTDCPPTMNECLLPACQGGFCGTLATAAGTPTSMQTSGDCQVNQCDGMGGIMSVAEDTDVPFDGSECTGDVCTMGVPSNPYLPQGTACMQNGGTTCDGMGTCH